MQRCFTSLQKHSREQQEEGGGGNASHRVACDIKQDGLLLVLKNNKEDNVTVSHQHSRHQTNESDQPQPSHTHNKYKKWRHHTAYLLVEITHTHTRCNEPVEFSPCSHTSVTCTSHYTEKHCKCHSLQETCMSNTTTCYEKCMGYNLES